MKKGLLSEALHTIERETRLELATPTLARCALPTELFSLADGEFTSKPIACNRFTDKRVEKNLDNKVGFSRCSVHIETPDLSAS